MDFFKYEIRKFCIALSKSLPKEEKKTKQNLENKLETKLHNDENIKLHNRHKQELEHDI